MTFSFTSIQLRWLLDATNDPTDVLATAGDVVGEPLKIPSELGSGYFEILQLPFGSSLFRGVHRFLPAAAGQLVPLGELTIDYGEPSLLVQTVWGGRICHREFLPELTLIYEDGKDFFCHVDRRRLIPMVDGASDSEMVCLCIRCSSLQALLGAQEAAALLEALGISRLQTYSVHAMPKSVAALLHTAISKPLLGSVRTLFAQAKTLEYLSALSAQLQLGQGESEPFNFSGQQVRALHAHLLELAGKVPALESLAQQFRLPARRLNDAFIQEYGESIFTFITGHRLDQAREVLLKTDTPMKVLAERLGYSHVNHFINAFRKRFGEPPGSLRRKGREG